MSLCSTYLLDASFKDTRKGGNKQKQCWAHGLVLAAHERLRLSFLQDSGLVHKRYEKLEKVLLIMK